MFAGEFLVTFEATNPSDARNTVKAQLLVDQREVVGLARTPRRNDPAEGWLRVTHAGKKEDWDILILPQPSQPFGETVIVPKGTIRKSPGES